MKQNELKDTRSGFGAGLLELGKKKSKCSSPMCRLNWIA